MWVLLGPVVVCCGRGPRGVVYGVVGVWLGAAERSVRGLVCAGLPAAGSRLRSPLRRRRRGPLSRARDRVGESRQRSPPRGAPAGGDHSPRGGATATPRPWGGALQVRCCRRRVRLFTAVSSPCQRWGEQPEVARGRVRLRVRWRVRVRGLAGGRSGQLGEGGRPRRCSGCSTMTRRTMGGGRRGVDGSRR